MPVNGKSEDRVRMADLHFILAHFKGQSQGHAHLDSDYLGKVDSYEQTTIAIKCQVTYGLSIGVLIFDIDAV